MDTTYISEDIEFRGDISYEGKLEVNGKFEGRVRSNGALIIGGSGFVKADIEVRQISVKGEVYGNMNSELITLFGSARVRGDLTCKQLQIERGAFHNGTTIMS